MNGQDLCTIETRIDAPAHTAGKDRPTKQNPFKNAGRTYSTSMNGRMRSPLVGQHGHSLPLLDNGKIDTRYRFRKGSFDGPLQAFNPTATVFNTVTNTEWRMQFIWPLSSAYLITHIENDYSRTIIGVPDRSYIWIMSRTPDIDDAEYQRLLDIAANSGYDTARIQRIPQQWPESSAN